MIAAIGSCAFLFHIAPESHRFCMIQGRVHAHLPVSDYGGRLAAQRINIAHRSKSRRKFLNGAVLAAPVVVGGLSIEVRAKAASHPAAAADDGLAARRNYPGKDTRLSISMWDFSWLQSSYPGGPYEHLEQRVAEAQDRSYYTLRVDCFPARLLETTSHVENNWTAGNLPAPGNDGRVLPLQRARAPP